MKPKVLLLQGTLSHYRVPIYNLINNEVDLTVAYSKKNECTDGNEFNIIQIPVSKFGCFYINKGLLSLCNKYDVVIVMPDLHYLTYIILPFLRRNFKVITWGIGFRASYKRMYDLSKPKGLYEKVMAAIYRASDANIFYMKETFNYWKNENLNEEAFFVAHNTVEVKHEYLDTNAKKDSFLFVGTLYREKGILELLNAYKEAIQNREEEFPTLNIIGKGDEYNNIKKFIAVNQLEDKIHLLGAIYDEKTLASYFSKALLCISPNQAGLSVLKSFGYGVPYVTKFDAITGGERLNIIDQENGFVYSKDYELKDILIKSSTDRDLMEQMSAKTRKYYLENATPQRMASGPIAAVQYVLKK